MVTSSCWPSRPGDTLVSNEPHVNKGIGSLGPSLKPWREMFLQTAVAICYEDIQHMDLFNRLSYGKRIAEKATLSSATSCPPNADLERTQVDYSLRYLKAILAGPQKSARTSLLFEVAFQYAEKGHMVLFISPTKVTRLPMVLSGCKYPSVDILKRIQMVYLSTKKEYLEFMASIHMKQKDPIRLMVVDDIDFYYSQAEKHNELALLARIYTFLLDAAAFLSQMQNDRKNYSPLCSVVCSMQTINENTSQIPNKSVLSLWFNDFITLKNGPITDSFLALIEQEASNGEMEQHCLEYFIGNQKIELYTAK